jgi:hypothetical protein
MKKNHIKKLKPIKCTDSVIKTRDTGIACIPTGNPPDSSL